MKTFTCSLLTVVAALTALTSNVARAETVDINEWSYGAIAYEPTTGEYHYAYNCGSRAEAERLALGKCTASDAEILCWCQNGFLALARDANGKYHTGHSWGDGASSRAAEDYALEGLDGRTGKVILMLTTDGQYIYKGK